MLIFVMQDVTTNTCSCVSINWLNTIRESTLILINWVINEIFYDWISIMKSNLINGSIWLVTHYSDYSNLLCSL